MSSQIFETHLPPANDRMVTTLFVAALLHGIVILGITFTSPDGDADSDRAPGLEVILVNDNAQRVKSNAKARYLAQRNQEGSGNTLSLERALIPKSSLAPAMRPGAANGDGVELHQAGHDAGDAQTLATQSRSTRIVYFAAAAAAQDAAEMPLLLEKRPDFGMDPNDDGVELRLRGESKNQLWISADTRESMVAVYLDRWRRKVERVGTLNFPDAARRDKLSGTPVVEVTIAANGRLEQALIRRSSGHSEIDAAALRILRLAAPFDPFPHDLSAKHDQIRIAYEWQFLGGENEGSRVLYSEP
jgi:protein TonB